MAAAPVSPHKQQPASESGGTPVARTCAECAAILSGPLAPHLCARCSRIQTVTGEDDYFSALGVERAFFQNPVLLQAHFYDRSRALHPDRFSRGSPIERALSLERMSLINQAYTALKDAESRTEYLLQLEGVKVPAGKGQMPLELAESWFEIQDLLSEDPVAARPRLEAFEVSLHQSINAEQDILAGLERQYDETGDRTALEKIAGRIQAKNYLKSLEKDINRIKSR